MKRVFDQNAINHLLDILKEEVACRDRNRPPVPALADCVVAISFQRASGEEGSRTAVRDEPVPLQEVRRPDSQR